MTISRRAAVVAAAAACVTLAGAAQARPDGAAVSYPDAMVVLGHSGANGFGSEPGHPFQDAPANSWATGTNSTVRSLYSRILAVNPAIRGHNANLAQDGATLKELAAQARRAIALRPKPELVVVQGMDNDIRCDGRDEQYYSEFRDGYAALLQTLAAGLPQARIFVVSSWGTLSSYAKAVASLGLGARLMHAGRGPCSIFAPRSGVLVPAHVSYLTRTLNGYHAALAAACAQVQACRYDGGAARRIAVTAADLSPRLEHLSLRGQAKLAAVEWAALY